MISASANELTRSGEVLTRGAFHSTQNSGNFGWYIKWNGPFRFGLTGIFGTSFEGGPLWPLWSFRSVGPKCPFPFAKIVVPSTALFYPAYKGSHTSPSVKRRSRRNFFRWWNPTWPESPSCCWPKISFVWARRLTNWTNRSRNVFNLLLTKEYV